MNIVPLNDVVVIKPLEADTVTAGGIVLPGNREKDRATKGEVMCAGPGKWEEGSFGVEGKFIKTTMKPGMIVLFHGFPTGLEVEEDRVKYKLIPEKQIMAVVAHA